MLKASVVNFRRSCRLGWALLRQKTYVWIFLTSRHLALDTWAHWRRQVTYYRQWKLAELGVLHGEFPPVMLNAWEVTFRGVPPVYQQCVDPAVLDAHGVVSTPVGKMRTVWQARLAMQTAIRHHWIWSHGAILNDGTLLGDHPLRAGLFRGFRLTNEDWRGVHRISCSARFEEVFQVELKVAKGDIWRGRLIKNSYLTIGRAAEKRQWRWRLRCSVHGKVAVLGIPYM